jgi:3-oxoacyl-[acyl-carrier protein] reductase
VSRRVLVTGSSRGIGKAIAERLSKDGFELILHCRSRLAEAQALQSALGASAVLQFDISDREAAAKALLADVGAHGAYYGVVLNAGLTQDGPFPGLSGEDWDRVLHSNLDGFYNVLQPLIMPMVQRRAGGRIVTLSSISGLQGNRGQVNYSASKAGIIGASKALALELAKREITVNCVAPGLIETDMTQELPLSADDIKAMIPLRRLGKAEEVAALVSFLMSDSASYITRQVISVNGGLSA